MNLPSWIRTGSGDRRSELRVLASRCLLRRLALIGPMAVAIAVAGCGSTTRTVTVETHTVTHMVTRPAKRVPVRRSAPKTSTPLPVLTVGDWTGRDPSEIGFSGDAGNVVTQLHWSSWTSTGATGNGVSNIQNCVPNCAQGTHTPVATTITLSSPANDRFTAMIETRNGQTTRWTYPSYWPGNASSTSPAASTAPAQASTSCGYGETIGPHGDCALIQAATQRIAGAPGTSPFHAPGLDTFTPNGQSVTFSCTIVGQAPTSDAPIYHCVSQQDPLDWFQFSFT